MTISMPSASSLTDLVSRAMMPITETAIAMQDLLARGGDYSNETTLVPGPTYRFPGVAHPTYLLIDLTIDRTGRIRCVECNTSNAAGSSVAGHDIPRVAHELSVMFSRGIDIDDESVLLTPVSPDTRSHPEIHTRAWLRTKLLNFLYGIDVQLCGANEDTLPRGPLAVFGPIPLMAQRMSFDSSGLRYAGRPVAFLNNPNILVQLARQLHLPVEEVIGSLAHHPAQPDPIHETAKMALLGLDKVAQQTIAARTGSMQHVHVRPAVGGVDDIVESALEVARTFGGAVLKPLAASGGTAVLPIDASASPDAVRGELTDATAKLEAKYGPNWAATCPMAAFEFIDIRPADSPTGPRRWDMRLQVLASEHQTLITPLSVRLCPEPIGLVLTRANAVNNLTGRTGREVARINVTDLVTMIDGDDLVLERLSSAAFDYARAATCARPADLTVGR